MNVLFCTNRNPHFPTITEYVEEALKSAGCSVTFFDDRRYILPGRLRKRFPVLEKLEIVRLNRLLFRRAVADNPDFVLVAGGHRVLSATVQRLKEKGLRTALWTIDPPIYFSPLIRSAPYYDHVFCGGTEAVEILKEHLDKPPVWLPFACDAKVHKPWAAEGHEKKGYAADLVFVGSYYPNRLELLEKLCGFNLVVRGPGWEQTPADSPLKEKIRPGWVAPEEWIRMFSLARIVVIIHYQDGRAPCYQASPKVYEALACSAFVLVDNQPDVFRVFRDAEHLVSFTDSEGLRRQAEYYLRRPEERGRISAQGRREVLANHTYRQRVEKILEIVKAAV